MNKESKVKDPSAPSNSKHNDINVLSVINQRLWDKAKWFGTGFIYTQELSSEPPVLGLSFRDKESAMKIFKGWKKLIGNQDDLNMINISIITGIDNKNPFHYKVQVSSDNNDLESGENNAATKFAIMARHNVMTPTNSFNLDNFKQLIDNGCDYYLAPSTHNEKTNQASFAPQEYWIKKFKIKIIFLWF